MKTFKLYRTLVLAAVLFASFGALAKALPAGAATQRPLFIDIGTQLSFTSALRDDSEYLDGALISINVARMNLSALQAVDDNQGGAVSVRHVRRLAGQKLSLKLPGVKGRVTLTVTSVREVIEGIQTYVGSVDHDPMSLFTITVHNAAVIGRIHWRDTLFLIENRPDLGVHTIKRINKALLPRADDSDLLAGVPRKSVDARSTSPTSKSLDPNGTVRVLFLYTPEVQSRNNVSMLISNIVSEFNGTLMASKVMDNDFLSLGGSALVNDNFTGQCRLTIIDRFRQRVGVFATVNTQLDQTDSDIAFLLIATDPTLTGPPLHPGTVNCHPQFGRIGGRAFAFQQSNPFGLSTDTFALGDLTALHEIGHILGGTHEIESQEQVPPGAPVFARGRVDPSDTWMTIMGGFIACPFTGLNGTCVRLPFWSNPLLSYNGTPMGVPGVSDMESALEVTMPVSAAWQPFSFPRPNIPNPINAHSEFCYGTNTVSWTAQPNTDVYQLFRSTVSSFLNPTLIYSGTSTITAINVTSGTWYLKARACNGSGCSDMTSQVSASRFNGCL